MTKVADFGYHSHGDGAFCKEDISSMSENVVSVNEKDDSVTTCEQSDVKRPTQTRLKLQPSSVVLDDVPKNKSGSVVGVDGLRYRKRRKTRRGKAKRRKIIPYPKLSWQDNRGEQDEKECSKRANNVRAKLFACGQPVAPYNTTQFLMEDHNDLQDLDVQLQAVTTNADNSNVPVLHKPSRARDSSFSVDSDEDFFYSSPEDEGDFLSKEFSNTYEDLHAERLNSMPKSQLIQEYLQLEEKVDVLEKRLRKTSSDTKDEPHFSDCEEGESKDDDTCENLEPSQKPHNLKQEVEKLLVENEQLRRENEHLRYINGPSAPSDSSVDSESDSTSSSSISASIDESSDDRDPVSNERENSVLLRTCNVSGEEMK